MKYFIILILGTFLFGSCNILDQKRVKGNGKIASKTFDYKYFSSIDAGNDMDIFLKQADRHGIRIETDENLLPYFTLRLDTDNNLEIATAANTHLDPTGNIKVYVTAPSLDKIDISGAAQLQTEGKFVQDKPIKLELSGASSAQVSLKAPVIDLDASGASTLTANGECRDIKTDASGASTINAFNLLAENADAEASGASTVRIFSSIQLKANANGASSIKYKGNPNVTSDASGASSITREN